MKLLNKLPKPAISGDVKLVAEENEDLWHAFNLIRAGDKVTANTFRKVSRDAGTGTESERVKLRLTLQVETIDYDAEGSQIRLKGRNLTETEHVKLGAYHSLELELHRSFVISKEVWDKLDLARLQLCTDPAASADVAILLIGDGIAQLCLIGRTCTVKKAKIEVQMPRKRGAAIAGLEKAQKTFHERVFDAVVQHIDWEVVKCLVIAGPGFAKDAFKSYLDLESQRQEVRSLLLNRSKIVLAPASTPYYHSIQEVLSSPSISTLIKNTKAAQEVAMLDQFLAMLGNEPARAFYGPGHVFAAHELGAIQTLLISDSLFRTNDVSKRAKYAALVDEVEAGGGKSFVFSAAHSSGQQLIQFTGIAAILRFPLPELEDQDIIMEQ